MKLVRVLSVRWQMNDNGNLFVVVAAKLTRKLTFKNENMNTKNVTTEPEGNAINKMLCTGLNSASREIHQDAKRKGFWDSERETGTLLMLCVSELSEALEADRKGRKNMLKTFERDMEFARLNDENFNPDDINYDWIVNRFETTIKDTFEDELADTVIRILDLCGARGIDLEKHINLKLKYNRSRERMHGKAY